MRRSRTYALAFGLIALAVAVMTWAALRPGTTFVDVFAREANAALSDVAQWYREGPADGRPDWQEASLQIYEGDASVGADLMVDYGCGACHAIPGVTGARGSVGPNLDGFANRAYVAGVLPNEPGGLVRWLVDPTVHSPQTAMPDLGVTEAQARDMAAYLYTLRGR